MLTSQNSAGEVANRRPTHAESAAIETWVNPCDLCNMQLPPHEGWGDRKRVVYCITILHGRLWGFDTVELGFGVHLGSFVDCCSLKQAVFLQANQPSEEFHLGMDWRWIIFLETQRFIKCYAHLTKTPVSRKLYDTKILLYLAFVVVFFIASLQKASQKQL